MIIAIIGGGAAGFFSAITAKTQHPDARVTILEQSRKILSKVRISGGGRCNVTNGCTTIKALAAGYPRGEKQLKKAFRVFNNSHTMEWFASRGVALYTQEDNRVFPVSDDSQTIIDCLLNESKKLGVRIELGQKVKAIQAKQNKLVLNFQTGDSRTFDKVIVATGGSPTHRGFEWLASLGHKIELPVPSLFTFNMPTESIKQLMGITIKNTLVSIQGTKLRAEGPLLITHWGMSGPAILKLSAFGARILQEKNYAFKVQVNWINIANYEVLMRQLVELSEKHPKKYLSNIKPYQLPERLWLYLLDRSQLPTTKKWAELGKKGLNKLITTLSNDVYIVKGKTTFKEEFVTAGGVNLDNVDFNTMQSKVCNNLYFAGEVLDIDGITGGYNFQAAWTTGFIAGQLG